MKVKDLKNVINNNNFNDDDEIKFYIWDYEYNDNDPEELGEGKFIKFDNSSCGKCLNIGIHKK